MCFVLTEVDLPFAASAMVDRLSWYTVVAPTLLLKLAWRGYNKQLFKIISLRLFQYLLWLLLRNNHTIIYTIQIILIFKSDSEY